MEFKNHYNKDILRDLETDDNLVICSPLGSGKSSSVKQYIHTNPDKKILLVLNQIKDLEQFKKDLPDNLIYVDKDSQIKIKEAVNIIHAGKYNCLAITKVRFNYMVTVRTKLFDDFDKIIIDESGGLSPIIQDTFDGSIDKILYTLKLIIKTLSKETLEKSKDLLNFLMDINSDYVSKQKTSAKVTKIKVKDEYKKIAHLIINDLLRLYELDRLSEHNIAKVFGLLVNILNDELYVNEYINGKNKYSNVLFINKFLKDYIKNKNIPIKVLDGTAMLLKPLYEWLELPIKNDYVELPKNYPNLKIHYYKFDDITSFEGRTNQEVRKRMLQFMKNEGIPNDYLIFTNKTSVEVFEKDYDKVDYAFSGNDVGTNIYRDEKNLVVVFYNTLPQSIRILWNMFIKGMDFERAISKNELDIAEYELVGSMLVQLVGRTAIRKDSNEDVNVYLFCVHYPIVFSVVEYFNIPRENIFVYNASLDLRKKTNLSVAGLLYMVELKLRNGSDEVDIMELAKEYYGDKLSKHVIKNTKKRHKNKFLELAEKYGMEYKTRKGWKMVKRSQL